MQISHIAKTSLQQQNKNLLNIGRIYHEYGKSKTPTVEPPEQLNCGLLNVDIRNKKYTATIDDLNNK